MPYTDFHYTPTGTGVISGKEVLEQTEDAINDLGGQISGDVQTAIDTANNALNTANTASADAQNAVNTANTAYTAATNAQNAANAAQNTASNALTTAQNAQNDVNALGNRVTTAENNITQNTTDISGLTTRMGTAEGNITTLQNDVITAQGTATSAQNTATLARGQAYVVRYASVAVSDNSSVPYTDLNNTDNIKANDLLLDTNGKLYQISSVDTANETAAVTTPLTQLAIDSTVIHNTGNETKSGELTLSDTLNSSDIVPIANNSYSLGSSNNQWKNIYSNQINGLTPSSLSLPVADRNSRIDILGYFTNTASAGTNEYTPPDNGYVMITISYATQAIAGLFTSGRSVIYNQSFTGTTTGAIRVLFPVVKGLLFILQSYSSATISFSNAYFIPCLGNV